MLSDINFERVFRLAAGISSLLLLLGFVVSTVLNQFVFWQWNLSFMTFAAPVDVIMSGINLVYDASITAIISLVVIFAAEHYSGIVEEADRKRGPWLYTGLAILLFMFAPIFSAIASAFETSGPKDWPFAFNEAAGIANTQISFGTALAAVQLWRLRRILPTDHLARLGALSGIVFALIAVVSGGINLVQIRASVGYETRLLDIVGLPDETCKGRNPIAYWVGSNYIVARCPGEFEHFVIKTDLAERFELSNERAFCRNDEPGLWLSCIVPRTILDDQPANPFGTPDVSAPSLPSDRQDEGPVS